MGPGTRGKRRRVGFVLGLVALAGLLGGLLAQGPASTPSTARGAFRILQGGKEVGQEEFEIEWSAEEIRARAQLTLKVEGKKVEETATLTLSPNYEPRSYEWKRIKPAGQFVRVQFEGSKAAVEFPSGEETDRREFEFEHTRVVILDNNFFHHYILLLRQYDFGRGGAQPVRILIPQALWPAVVTLELQGLEEATEKAAGPSLRKLRMTSEDNEVWLWVDEKAELTRLAAPQAGVEVIRRLP